MTGKDLFYYALAFVGVIYGVYLLVYMTRDQAARAYARENMRLARESMARSALHMQSVEIAITAGLQQQREILEAVKRLDRTAGATGDSNA